MGGESIRAYVIAEMANAHEGSLEKAFGIVDGATRAGADAIKFQCFTAEELLVKKHSMYETFRKLEMPWQHWEKLILYTKEQGLDVLCDVFGLESACRMIDLSPAGLKIHASDLSNTPLLRHVGNSGLPVLLSSGGASWIEIAEAVESLNKAGAHSIVLMHGIQNYPTAIRDCGLLKLRVLAEQFNLPVGYADHVDAEAAEAFWLPLLAVAVGARLIEKHITLDRSKRGTDFYSSLNPDEFARLIAFMRMCEEALGHWSLKLSEAEISYRRSVKKGLVASAPLESCGPIREKDVVLKRIEEENSLVAFPQVLGKILKHGKEDEQGIRFSDLEHKVVATLACRVQSTRLYAKPLQLIGGQSILLHLINRLKTITHVTEIVLAISEGQENLVFVDLAKEQGLPYVIGDQKDVLGRLIKAAEMVHGDILLRVTTENPFIYHENVDSLIEDHVKACADLTVCELLPNGAHVEIINIDSLRRAHKFGEDRHRSELCTLFIFENPDLFSINRISAPPEVARPDLRLTVDTPEDLMVARNVYDALSSKFGSMLPLDEIVKYLDHYDEIRKISSHLETMKLFR